MRVLPEAVKFHGPSPRAFAPRPPPAPRWAGPLRWSACCRSAGLGRICSALGEGDHCYREEKGREN